ncbi:metal ABC transporter solute-binding protein, Zn/Mn family [Streptomyces sp. NPDC057743]|uniref:metal ABC transporter solute-binding protein, Zn/Mn family n=1 Tax=Streptomyces sp. NPDC057743 TaxID=3346236 RepID=UPI0036A12C69
MGPVAPLAMVLVLAGGCAASSGSGAGGGGGSSGAPVRVVASTNVYGDLVRTIGGDRVTVYSIISDPAQDPHSYQASAYDRLELAKARLVVENGGGYDDFVGRLLQGAVNPSPTVIDAVRVSGRMPKAGRELNEHVWYDLPSMGRLVERIAGVLGKADPADAPRFRRNAAALQGELTALERREARVKAEHGGAAVAVTEPLPLYMTGAMGLRNVTPGDFSRAVEDGNDVSARTLERTLALFTGKRVKALVYNAQTSGPPSEKVEAAAKEHGVPEVPVNETLPRGQHYPGWMSANIAAIADALERR